MCLFQPGNWDSGKQRQVCTIQSISVVLFPDLQMLMSGFVTSGAELQGVADFGPGQ